MLGRTAGTEGAAPICENFLRLHDMHAQAHAVGPSVYTASTASMEALIAEQFPHPGTLNDMLKAFRRQPEGSRMLDTLVKIDDRLPFGTVRAFSEWEARELWPPKPAKRRRSLLNCRASRGQKVRF